MSAVGKTPIGLKFIRISSHTLKNIQEGIANIICEEIDILSHPKHEPSFILLFSRAVLEYINTQLGKNNLLPGILLQPYN